MAFIDKSLPGFEWMADEADAAPQRSAHEQALRDRQSAQRAAARNRAVGAPRNPEGVAEPVWLTELEAAVKRLSV